MGTVEVVDATVKRGSGDAVDASVGTIGRIPIRNIWLLMLYASDLYRELPRTRTVGVEDNPDKLPDLVAELLTRAVERRMRRNLSFGYRRRHADINRVRGRIDLLRTERRQLLERSRIACSFEELTVDTPRNQFVKAALNLLRRTVSDPQLVHRCRTAVATMERAGVSGDPVSSNHQRPQTPFPRLDRLSADDRQMLAASYLAFDLRFPTEDMGVSHLTTPDRDEYWARKLFERAVAGFYDVVLSPKDWHVSSGRRIHWPVDSGTPGISEVLPSMQTDIELERPVLDNQRIGRERIIIDTKFTSVLTSGLYRDQTLKSGYIYQMYAYLRSQERGADPSTLDSTGIMLHPSVGCHFDDSAVIQGHRIRFVTVDLAADSQTIRHELFRIVDAAPSH